MNFLTLAQIAFRNTLKNRRRAVLTALAVGLGFLAYSLIEAYFTNVYRTLEDQAVIGERLGHLVITKKDFYRLGPQNPEKYSFSGKELEQITQAVSKNTQIELLSPRLSVSGLISNGDSSRIFFGEAISPKDLTGLRGAKYAYLPGKLSETDANSGVFGAKLAEFLAIKTGAEAVLMTSTIGGMVNARDIKVGEISNTGSSATDDKFVLLPLEYTRKLLAFDGADRIIIKLKDGAKLDQERELLNKQLTQLGMQIEIKSWKEVSQYFNQVKGLFDMMNLFFAVVLALVVMATVTNTIVMSISERTREIGTMRAFGMQARTLNLMFLLEGGFITLIGSSVAAVLTVIVANLINMMKLTYTPPDASSEAALQLTLLPENLFGTGFTLFFIGALSAFLIARRATRANIVESLSHV